MDGVAMPVVLVEGAGVSLMVVILWVVQDSGCWVVRGRVVGVLRTVCPGV